MRLVAVGGVFSVDILEERPGIIMFRVQGGDELFRNAAGGHRYQRVPKNDKHGRRHTSTVTVAIMPETNAQESFRADDVRWWAVRGSGKGGQHRNTTDSAVTVEHIPTGLRAHSENERSQPRNRDVAMSVLAFRVREQALSATRSAQNASRRAQVGLGERGDKVVTVRLQDGQVTHHGLGRKMRWEDYKGGETW